MKTFRSGLAMALIKPPEFSEGPDRAYWTRCGERAAMIASP